MEKILQFNNEFINKLYSPSEERYWELYLDEFEKHIRFLMRAHEYTDARLCIKELHELSELMKSKFDNLSIICWAQGSDLYNEIADQQDWYNKVADVIR